LWTNFNIWQLWKPAIGNALNLQYSSTVWVSRDTFCKILNILLLRITSLFMFFIWVFA